MPVEGNLSANETQVLLAAALEGVGIAMQPVFSAAPLIAEGRLIALLPDYELGIYGVYASPRLISPALRTMIDFLAEWFSADSDWARARRP